MNRIINLDEIKDIELKNPLKKKKINPLAVGAAGLAVGAGLAAAITLKRNKKLRKKVQNLMGDIREQAMNYASDIKEASSVKKSARKTKSIKAGKK